MYPYGPAVLCLAVGTIFVAHGAQMLLGVWGGPGLSGTAAFMGQLGLGPGLPLALLAGIVELVGGVMLILGALTLLVALALAVIMGVAIFKVHLAAGFF